MREAKRQQDYGRHIDCGARSVAALIGLCGPVSVGHGGVPRTLTSSRKPETIAAAVGSATTRIC